MVALKDNMKM